MKGQKPVYYHVTLAELLYSREEVPEGARYVGRRRGPTGMPCPVCGRARADEGSGDGAEGGSLIFTYCVMEERERGGYPDDNLG